MGKLGHRFELDALDSRARRPRPRACCVAQHAIESRRLGALVGCEIEVTRRKRETVRRSNRFRREDFDRQRELLHHVAQHEILLVVLLADPRLSAAAPG